MLVNPNLDTVPTASELDDYRATARSWLAANLPALDPSENPLEQEADTLRDLIRRLHSGGYSGICFPTEVGGAGLSRYHHRVFLEEASNYELPIFIGNPGLSIIAPPILEFGTEEQVQHVAAMLRGDEIFVQMMSEPSGGSDMAGARTRADRDGDVWVLNGSKIWSSGAWRSTWGLILVRTDWTVPKHRGLSLFLLDLSLPGITVNKIKMVNGVDEFCQEYFDNVLVPNSCLLGQPNDGWTVASRLLFHERSAVGGNSPYAFDRRRSSSASAETSPVAGLVRRAKRAGRAGDPRVRELVGRAHADQVVQRQLIEYVTEGMTVGTFPAIAGSLLRLNSGVTQVDRSRIAVAISGRDGLTWDEDDDSGTAAGEDAIFRQASCIGGGTTEMQRNLISERVMGMPREFAADKDRPYNEVRTGRP